MDLNKIVGKVKGMAVIDAIYAFVVAVINGTVKDALSTELKSSIDLLWKDYQLSLIFAGMAGKDFKPFDQDVKDTLTAYAKGFGFLVQGKKVMSWKGRLLTGVVSLQLSPMRKKLTDFGAITEENMAEHNALQSSVKQLEEYLTAIKDHCTSEGNAYKDELKEHRRHIMVTGVENGSLEVHVSGFPITDDEPGMLLIASDNGSIGIPFCETGESRGLAAVMEKASDSCFYVFSMEGKDLFINEHWFKGGKEKSREYGRLIK